MDVNVYLKEEEYIDIRSFTTYYLYIVLHILNIKRYTSVCFGSNLGLLPEILIEFIFRMAVVNQFSQIKYLFKFVGDDRCMVLRCYGI